MIENVDTLDPMIREGEASLIISEIDGIKSSCLHIQNGHLMARGGVCLPVIDGKTCLAAFGEANPSNYDGVLVEPLEPTAELSQMFMFRGSPNYYHFMVFSMPSLFMLAADLSPKLTIATTAGFPSAILKFAPKLVEMFAGGRPFEVVQIPHADYRVRDVIVPTRASKALAVKIADPIRKVVFQDAGIEDPIRDLGAIKLFVRRGGTTSGRNLINQDAVENWFVARGYTPVDPGTLSFEEQVLVFARATHIAGVEGSAMTNILFAAQAQDIVLLASPATQGDPFFAKLAGAMGVPFRTLHGAIPRSADFAIAMSGLEALDIG